LTQGGHDSSPPRQGRVRPPPLRQTEPVPPHNGSRPRSRPVPPASPQSAPEQLQKATFALESSAAGESNASQTGSVSAHALSCLPESPPAPAAPTPPARHGGSAPASHPAAQSDTGRTLERLRRTLPDHSQAPPESREPPPPPPARTHHPRRLADRKSTRL